MGFRINDILSNIHNPNEATLDFINQWNNSKPYIIAHTSGSTGIPKEIQLKKNDMIKSAKATCTFFNITKKSKMMLPLSPNYIAGKMMIVRAIVSGAELWIEEPSNRPLKYNYGKLDLLPVVPTQIDWIVSLNNSTKITNLIVGGGELSVARTQQLLKSGINTYSTFGMTETCSHIALRHISSDYYKTLPGITISQDVRGCLIITAPEFSFHQITTNDIVDVIDSNHFIWKGRIDNVINSGGIKIHPEQIEKKISSIITSPFYIVGEDDEKWGERITLYIESSYIDKTSIVAKLKTILDKHSIPQKIECVKQFYRTNNGKIKRIKNLNQIC